jgi:alkanesulfonate monooxygenase SsuD/methylene tetrahydromethanopterin reductase-like flavin-dependent oxidoreductase (luciferase family)
MNPIVVAKQLGSLDRLAGGRLTAGLALGGWPDDYEASGLPLQGRGQRFDAMLTTMRRVWAGEIEGAAGPMPALAGDRPGLLVGGLVAASFRRVAALADGWVAPFFGGVGSWGIAPQPLPQREDASRRRLESPPGQSPGSKRLLEAPGGPVAGLIRLGEDD